MGLMKNPRRTRKATGNRQAEERLRGLFNELLGEPGEDGIIGFCRHAGIHLTTSGDVQTIEPAWWSAFLGHYVTSAGVIDHAQVAADLATWGPIVSRVAELRRERRQVGAGA